MSPTATRTIRRQILTGYVITIVIIVLLLASAIGALITLDTAHDRVLDTDVQQIVDGERLGRVAARIAVAERGFLITGNEEALADLEELSATFEELLAQLQSRANTDHGRELLAAVARTKEEWDAARERVITEAADLDPVGRLELGEQELLPLLEDVTAVLDDAIERQEERVDEADRRTDRRGLVATAIVLALGAAAVLVAIVVGGRTTRRTDARLRRVAEDIDALATEILASTEQQVAGAAEQAAAVQQTVTSVEELTQTAGQSAERARTVASGAQQSAEAAAAGAAAVEETATGMQRIREQVESIATTVLALTEHTQLIGEIVDAVDELSDRTHLLALNASVEAARAGEHGRGFAVVASEIRALADEARQATAKVGKLLGEIQEGATSAVLVTEEGTRSVEEGVRRVADAGATITELAQMIDAATLAAEQIAASSNQQAVATSQIEAGMRNIDEVMEQNLAAARQMEQAARSLDEVAARLRALVGAIERG